MQYKILLLASMLLVCHVCQAQKKYTIQLLDQNTQTPIPDATIRLPKQILISDANGIANIPIDSVYTIINISLVGYENKTDTLWNRANTDTIFIHLSSMEDEEDEVVVKSTRNGKSISNIPTRIEVLNGEEIDEKINMKPGDIRMLLNETTGIQTQQISATSGASSIRIQGLDGRYTQILKDGFPIFAGFGGGLGLLQTPPLDLQQVEIIKGSASTLFGGGAIAGLVNLISKVPKEKRELRFIANGTSARGLDLSAYYSQRFAKTGWTILATHNMSKAYAPDNIIFSAIPKTKKYIFNPKLFLYIDSATTMTIGINTLYETRLGGNMDYIKKGRDGYFENNQTRLAASQIMLRHNISSNSNWEIKNSVNAFDRKISIPDYRFHGMQWSTYSEFNYSFKKGTTSNVIGSNIYTDNFKDKNIQDGFPSRSYKQTTIGIFEQYSQEIFSDLTIEAGLRGDYTFQYGASILPRLAFMWRITPSLTSRIGGGLGYKTPTIFLEEAERIQFRNVLPINPDSNRLERSYGLNWDVNYKTKLFGIVDASFNQLFFYTKINHPLLLENQSSNIIKPVNMSGDIHTKGWETNIKLKLSDFAWYIGYTYTDATLHINGQKTPNPLTSKTRLNNVLMYEVEDKWKIGFEAYYYSRQYLNDNSWGKDYWIFGFMAERKIKKISLFINFENFTDTRQTKFGNIYSGPISNPVFKDIYAPLDGSVVNGGIKINL